MINRWQSGYSVRLAVATDRDGAIQYLGVSQSRFKMLLARRIVKPLGHDWFAYADLDEAIERLRQERDKGNILQLEVSECEADQGNKTKRRKIRSQGRGPYRTPDEFLR